MKIEAPPGFRLRRYQNTDWESYLDLDVASRLEERGLDPDRGQSSFMVLRKRRLARAYHFSEKTPPPHPPHQIFVLEHDGDYVGHLWTTDTTDDLTDELVVSVTSVAVRRKFRGRGLARFLLSAAEALAKSRQAGEVRLSVGRLNDPARRLFQECGFSVMAERMAKAVK